MAKQQPKKLPTKKRISVQMSITIPPDLRREMEEFGAGVNWSQVAADAFRLKVREAQASQGGSTVEEVIARMKAAGEVEANEDYQEGKQFGDEWARDKATPGELRRLQRGIDALSNERGGAVGVWTNGLNAGCLPGLYTAITGEKGTHSSYRKAVEFWEWVLGEDSAERVESPHFARGFIEGAIGVWDAVKSHI